MNRIVIILLVFSVFLSEILSSTPSHRIRQDIINRENLDIETK